MNQRDGNRLSGRLLPGQLRPLSLVPNPLSRQLGLAGCLSEDLRCLSLGRGGSVTYQPELVERAPEG